MLCCWRGELVRAVVGLWEGVDVLEVGSCGGWPRRLHSCSVWCSCSTAILSTMTPWFDRITLQLVVTQTALLLTHSCG